ncbi:MAG: glycosyltransferase [Bacteroidota bacterium]
MRNEIMINHNNSLLVAERQKNIFGKEIQILAIDETLPEILFITSYPPRQCGIATYSQDLIKALNNKFDNSFKISICPIESENEKHIYTDEIKFTLNIDTPKSFVRLAETINEDPTIQMVMIQHEFGLFKDKEGDFIQFLNLLLKPVSLVFHTVLPNPNGKLRFSVQQIADVCESIVVMTKFSKNILLQDYGVEADKITVIPHGTHLVAHSDRLLLKEKYQLKDKKVLSTFGLLSSGKCIETTLEAMPAIITENPEIMFLIIGKTHPSVVKQEGEKYRKMLTDKVKELNLQNHVQFVNEFLPLSTLLEYLQLTDIYLFTSKDPNQAVSGTFSYAMSCGCAIVSTPIPHAREVLKNDGGVIFDFENSTQLSNAVLALLNEDELRKNLSMKGLHRIVPTAWENAAIAHALLFENMSEGKITLNYQIPVINLDHVKRLTTNFGMIQFSVINQPDIDSGYTLDDNARAMVAMCQHYELTKDEEDLKYIGIYLDFISFCLKPEGYFLNYVNEHKNFTEQNYQTNLADSNGRAIWALGFLISLGNILPEKLITQAELTMQSALSKVHNIHSTRAMAFIIKGLYYRNLKNNSIQDVALIKELANRLVQMYRHESDKDWAWFESYLTYGNSILPEAMLCAWMATNEPIYREIAKTSFDFLLAKIFKEDRIKVISNKGWSHKGDDLDELVIGGEQPIDIAYTILALNKFYDVFKDEEYQLKMKIAFNWFLGNNHIHQIIYNPCTGGCYDGLEENYINLNQGAESTVSYLMARMTIEKNLKAKQKNKRPRVQNMKLNLENELVESGEKSYIV